MRFCGPYNNNTPSSRRRQAEDPQALLPRLAGMIGDDATHIATIDSRRTDDEAYLPGCSSQNPYPTQGRERIDKHQRPAVRSDHLIRTLLSARAAEMGNPG